MNTKKLLGKRIKELRKNKKFTQEQLSEKINMDITTMSGIESGRHYPSLVTLEKIAKALNVDIPALFDYNKYLPIDVIRQTIIDNLPVISDEDLIFIYRFITKKYQE